MLKKLICLLGLSVLILSTSICFAESQSPDKILSQIYLGQPLEEIQQNFSLEFKEYDEEEKTTSYKAFINPLEGYDVSIEQPITLTFFNNKLSGVSMISSWDIPKDRLEHLNKLKKIVQDIWGNPMSSETKQEGGESKFDIWVPKGKNLLFGIIYINAFKLPGNETAKSSFFIQFLSREKEELLK